LAVADLATRDRELEAARTARAVSTARADARAVDLALFGLPYSEAMLLKLAYSYEQATLRRLPPKTTPVLPK
jgi:Asp-tRNA(Asn)/Glu-tRNA(Gln) amidotransferase A subunit family amidase